MTLERNNAIAVVDLVAERVTDILPLGFKNNALPGKGLDASDMDGGIGSSPGICAPGTSPTIWLPSRRSPARSW